MKLTASTIAGLTLPDGIDDRIYFCETLPGFGVRLRRGGGRSLVLQYSVGGKTRKIPLGPVTELAKARMTAKDLLAKVRLGGDPAHAKAQSRVRATETLGSLIRPFMIHQQTKLKPRSLVETRRHLEKLCRTLHPLPIAAVDRRTIAARLVSIAQDNGPAAANRVRGSLGAFFSWCIGQGLIETNPTSLVPKAAENGPRERTLSDVEIASIWRALDGSPAPYAAIVRLLILTGLRRSEISDLCWSEVDFEANLITIPAVRTKNGKPHDVPMSAEVRKLLEAQPRRADRDRVFGAPLWHRAKVDLDTRIAGTNDGVPLPGWTLHDCRRTFSTGMHELGIPPHVVEAMIGHVGHKSGVAGVYNQASYLPERTRALIRWAGHVMAIVSGETAPAEVIQLRA